MNRRILAALLTAMGTLVAIGALTVVGAQSAPGKPGQQPRNPLAGKWQGMTAPTDGYPGPRGPVSYRITKAGVVKGFEVTVTPNQGVGEVPCPTPVPVVVKLPPFNLSKPTTNFPKGKKFAFEGTATSPPGAVSELSVKVAPPFKAANTMAGYIVAGIRKTIPTPGGGCKTGLVHIDAHK